MDNERDEFERAIEQALASLPEPFRSRLDSVAIVVDDQAGPELLAQVGAPGLFGLYQGVPRTAYGVDNAPVTNKITIFRRPLESAYPDPRSRARAVQETVLHEIAHHFGISDARLRELSRERRGGR
jgi:predicted Zn-dependent protease with MMP-like domain